MICNYKYKFQILVFFQILYLYNFFGLRIFKSNTR